MVVLSIVAVLLSACGALAHVVTFCLDSKGLTLHNGDLIKHWPIGFGGILSAVSLAMQEDIAAGTTVQIASGERETELMRWYLTKLFNVDSTTIETRQPMGLCPHAAETHLLSTQGWDDAIHDFNAMKELVELSQNMMRTLKCKDTLESWDQVVDIEAIKVAVLGQPKVGKSTFTNGLSGKAVSPVDFDICTGSMLEILSANAAAQEVTEIELRSYSDMVRLKNKASSRAESIRSNCQQQYDACMKSPEQIHWSCLRHTEKCLDGAKDDENRVDQMNSTMQGLYSDNCVTNRDDECLMVKPLEDLHDFVSSSGGNLLPDFARKVSAKIHGPPLLDVVTFVDLPGVGDKDVHRSSVADLAYGHLDVWLWLVPAGEGRMATTMANIQRAAKMVRGGKHRGLFVYSKPASLQKNFLADQRKMRSTHRTWMKDIGDGCPPDDKTGDYCGLHNHGEDSMVWAEMQGWYQMMQLPGSSRSDREALHGSLSADPHGISWLTRLMPTTAEKPLKDLLSQAARGGNAETTLLSDLFLDSSGVLDLMHRVREISLPILTERVGSSRSGLSKIILNRHRRMSDRLTDIDKQLFESDSIPQQLEDLRVKREDIALSISQAVKKREEITERLTRCFAQALKASLSSLDQFRDSFATSIVQIYHDLGILNEYPSWDCFKRSLVEFAWSPVAGLQYGSVLGLSSAVLAPAWLPVFVFGGVLYGNGKHELEAVRNFLGYFKQRWFGKVEHDVWASIGGPLLETILAQSQFCLRVEAAPQLPAEVLHTMQKMSSDTSISDLATDEVMGKGRLTAYKHFSENYYSFISRLLNDTLTDYLSEFMPVLVEGVEQGHTVLVDTYHKIWDSYLAFLDAERLAIESRIDNLQAISTPEELQQAKDDVLSDLNNLQIFERAVSNQKGVKGKHSEDNLDKWSFIQTHLADFSSHFEICAPGYRVLEQVFEPSICVHSTAQDSFKDLFADLYTNDVGCNTRKQDLRLHEVLNTYSPFLLCRKHPRCGSNSAIDALMQVALRRAKSVTDCDSGMSADLPSTTVLQTTTTSTTLQQQPTPVYAPIFVIFERSRLPEMCLAIITLLSVVWYLKAWCVKPKSPKGFEAIQIVKKANNPYDSFDVVVSVNRFVMELHKFDLPLPDAKTFWRALSAQHQQAYDAEMVSAAAANLPDDCQDLAKAEASAQIFWTSSVQVSFCNDNREFCWLVNWAIRTDEIQLIKLLQPFCVSLNRYCIPRPAGLNPLPTPPVTLYRGIGVPDDHAHLRAFFTQGKVFKVDSFVASTPQVTVATDFLRKAVGSGRQPLMFVIDLQGGCTHVSCLQLSVHPHEIEWLFTIYAPFMVMNADWRDNPTAANPHTIQLMKIHHLNHKLPPNLALAPWF